MILKKVILSIAVCMFSFTIFSQEEAALADTLVVDSQSVAVVIKLDNPSFEDEPYPGKVPEGWKNCGPEGETPPDTQPTEAFDVIKEPFDGNSYLGLVVRDNETWESVGQQLETPLKAGTCYELKAQIARSQYYVSLSRLTSHEVNYTTSARIKIWGGIEEDCDKTELLAKTGRINNAKWKEETFILTPTSDYDYIIIEAYYVTPTKFAYNGNILLDNLSDLTPIPCVDE